MEIERREHLEASRISSDCAEIIDGGNRYLTSQEIREFFRAFQGDDKAEHRLRESLTK